jgi:hypothetical protein
MPQLVRGRASAPSAKHLASSDLSLFFSAENLLPRPSPLRVGLSTCHPPGQGLHAFGPSPPVSLRSGQLVNGTLSMSSPFPPGRLASFCACIPSVPGRASPHRLATPGARVQPRQVPVIAFISPAARGAPASWVGWLSGS